MKKLLFPLTLMFGLIGTANAFEGDAEAGKVIAAGTCVACHGPDGNSPVAMYPKLAGQHAEYLYKQLKDFKLGVESSGKLGRSNAIMAGMVAPLSDTDMQNLAAYFASQKMKPGSTPENLIEKGQQLYRGGDSARGIPACAACHGPRGTGSGLARFPKIGFQSADYMKTTLEDFRAGRRANDPNGMMQDIAKKLTDADIALLSQYLGGLH